MLEITGYIAALLIGISLGIMGGGGSILTVPVLVYLLHVHPLLATTYSLFVVGITSFVGGARAYIHRNIDFRVVTEFGIPSILSVFIARHFLLPAIPGHIFYVGRLDMTREKLLMLVFAGLMFFVALLILYDKTDEQKGKKAGSRGEPFIPLVVCGLILGMITGLLGAGGGFLIIPILLLYLKLPMKTAVGTSLLIIAINSLFGFLFSLKQFSFDWKILLLFTGFAIAGILIGSRFADKIPAHILRKTFGWFILLTGIYIIIRELFFVAA